MTQIDVVMTCDDRCLLFFIHYYYSYSVRARSVAQREHFTHISIQFAIDEFDGLFIHPIKCQLVTVVVRRKWRKHSIHQIKLERRSRRSTQAPAAVNRAVNTFSDTLDYLQFFIRIYCKLISLRISDRRRSTWIHCKLHCDRFVEHFHWKS